MSALRSHHGRNQDDGRRSAEPDEEEQRHCQGLRAFLATLNREERRLYAAVESNRIGRGGVVRVAELTGLCMDTIARGRRELADLLQGKPIKKPHKPVRGRPRVEETYPGITAALQELLSDEVAGCPQDEYKWVRSSVRKLSRRLREQGFPVGHNAVWALLRRMGFSLRTAVRRRRGICKDPAARDEQFRYIASQRKAFLEARLPVISVDTKKKE
jgi:hypothetical protein